MAHVWKTIVSSRRVLAETNAKGLRMGRNPHWTLRGRSAIWPPKWLYLTDDELGIEFSTRGYPVIFRMLADKFRGTFPEFTRRELMRAVYKLWPIEMGRQVKWELDPTKVKDPWKVTKDARHLWYFLIRNPGAQEWWNCVDRRAKGRFRSTASPIQDAVVEALEGAYLIPWAIAHFDIPDALAYDDDVVAAVAYCQMFHRYDLKFIMSPMWGISCSDPHYANFFNGERCARGLYKLLSHRWVKFALYAPYMSPIGVTLSKDFTLDILRMGKLLNRPYEATWPELDLIEKSLVYLEAKKQFHRDHQLVGVSGRTEFQRFKLRPRHPRPGPIYFRDRSGNIWPSDLSQWCLFEYSRSRRRT